MLKKYVKISICITQSLKHQCCYTIRLTNQCCYTNQLFKDVLIRTRFNKCIGIKRCFQKQTCINKTVLTTRVCLCCFLGCDVREARFWIRFAGLWDADKEIVWRVLPPERALRPEKSKKTEVDKQRVLQHEMFLKSCVVLLCFWVDSYIQAACLLKRVLWEIEWYKTCVIKRVV